MAKTGRGALARSAGTAILVAACLVPRPGWSADDPRDAAFLAPVLQRTLESARTEVEIPWRNPATGHGGNIVIQRTFYREPEKPCRAYLRTLEPPSGALEVTRGTACRTSTGYWEIEEQPATAAAPGAERGTGTRPGATTGTARADPPARAATEADAGPICPDTVLVPLPAVRPPALAYTLPSRAAL